jgi:hypothetical protein
MRKPEDIKELDSMQIDAYYKSFLIVLNESARVALSEWELGFLESCLECNTFSEGQKAVMRDLMDRNPRCTPRFDQICMLVNEQQSVKEFCKVISKLPPMG